MPTRGCMSGMSLQQRYDLDHLDLREVTGNLAVKVIEEELASLNDAHRLLGVSPSDERLREINSGIRVLERVLRKIDVRMKRKE